MDPVQQSQPPQTLLRAAQQERIIFHTRTMDVVLADKVLESGGETRRDHQNLVSGPHLRKESDLAV